MGAPIQGLMVSTYTVPTEAPETDGTFAWSATTLVLVEASAAGQTGDVSRAHLAMLKAVRNQGRDGPCAMAISAVDVALWDLKARLLGVPLSALLGAEQPALPVYGSGGFTSYTVEQLERQLGGWVEQGLTRVKLKVGRDPAADVARVAAARKAIGSEASLFVDANGAYTRPQALALAHRFAEQRVSWFEEPVSSDDVPGLTALRTRVPAGMAIAAGEYVYELDGARRLLDAVDVLQLDVTRCGGITGFLRASALARAAHVPVSSHCAPALHVAVGCATAAVHAEYFHDHVHLERLVFDGVPEPKGGVLRPDLQRPGLGLELKRADARRFLTGEPR